MKLRGKGVLVTGGGTGIGRAVALALAGEGCRVVVAGRREDKLRETASLARGDPPILHHIVDVADRESIARLFEWTAVHLDPIDILVQAAGMNIRHRSLAEADAGDFDKVLATNASGAFYCMRAVLPQMRSRGDGLIVNISSVAGKRGSVLAGVAYSASKFAMTALGTCAGLEENQHGIRITNIYPGEVNTPILEERATPPSAEHRAGILQPEDVAAVVVAVAQLPPRANVPELVIKPTSQPWA